MKNIYIYTFLMLILFVTVSCDDELEIQQSYDYSVENLPVPKRVKQGETVEIRCEIVCDGDFEKVEYYLRYFQPDGKGELRFKNTSAFLPNDLYRIDEKVFRLYYTSKSSDTQTIDIYFIDSFNKKFNLSFSFNSEDEEDKENILGF